MVALLKQYWYLAVILALAGALLFVYTHPAKPDTPLTKKQDKQVKAEIGNLAASSASHEAKAATANAASDASYAKGQAAAARAQANRLQTHRKPHAPQTTISDTAAARIQRLLAEY